MKRSLLFVLSGLCAFSGSMGVGFAQAAYWNRDLPWTVVGGGVGLYGFAAAWVLFFAALGPETS